MQLIQDARLNFLKATSGTTTADGAETASAAASDGSTRFSAVIGGIPAAPPPIGDTGADIAGQGGDAGAATLAGSLLPVNGSLLPVAPGDGDGVVFTARLPLEPPRTAASGPNAAVGFMIENGRLRVSAGDRSDALPAGMSRSPAVPPAAGITAGEADPAPAAGAVRAGSTAGMAASARPVGIAGLHPVLVPAAEAATAAGGVAPAASEAPRPAGSDAATRSPLPPATHEVPRAGLAAQESPLSGVQAAAMPSRTSAGAGDLATMAAAIADPAERRARGKDFGESSRRASPRLPSAAAGMPAPGQPTGANESARPGANSPWTVGGDFNVALRADAIPASQAGQRTVTEAAALLADAGSQATEAAALRSSAPPASLTAGGPASATTMPAFSVAPPVLDPAWQSAVGERVVWMAARGVQSAELRLNPAELGPMQLQVSVDDGRVNVSITALQAATREALEAALPRLREMLSESGMQLAGADVSGGGVAQRRDDGFGDAAELSSYSDGADDDPADDGAVAGTGAADSGATVDFYA